jgi:hypothetical protein
MNRIVPGLLLVGVASLASGPSVSAADPLAPVSRRFAAKDATETPDFRQHVVPLLGKLGCNGRACHGSFQGQGGFRLSLFGYDFQLDHDGLTGGENPRVDKEVPEESLALEKPTLTVPHKGGKRLEVGSWEWRLLVNWVKGGAQNVAKSGPEFVRLEVTPSEIAFAKSGEKVDLQAVAVWTDGTREDVTPLCRFQTNDGQVAEIDANGRVTGQEPGDTHVVVSYDTAVVPVPVLRPVSDLVGTKYPQVEIAGPIDEHVTHKLRKLGIVPSAKSDDAEFLRRVSLDATGTLPTPAEIEAFLADTAPDKRAKKIDELLESPAYAAWWATRLSDWTGNNDTQLQNALPVRGRASAEWYEWLRKRVADNTPYDDLVAGIVLAQSRQAGESYEDFCKSMSALYGPKPEGSFADRDGLAHYWARRTFVNPDDRAMGFAYTFLGIRIQCAQCHKHPFDRWTQSDFKQFTGFFTRVGIGVDPAESETYDRMTKDLGLAGLRNNDLQRAVAEALGQGKTVPFQEIRAVPPAAPRGSREARAATGRLRTGTPAASGKLLGGDVVDLTKFADARQPLMDWLRRPDNPLFARAFVNRVWANYFHAGIVEPPDDLSLANAPRNAELLDWLAKEFVAHGFDVKWLHRTICNSRTYQTTWTPNETNRHDERNFSRAVPRRLPAEVAYDAIQAATASDAKIDELHKDVAGRAIGGGAPIGVRAQNTRSTYALSVFGRSSRETNCDCDRSSEASLLQTVYLQNDSETLGLLAGRKDGWVEQVRRTRPEPDVDAVVRSAYLRTLSRLPTPDETVRARAFVAGAKDRTDGAQGLLWALLNTKEFIVNH